MKTATAVKYFKSRYNIAKALGISNQAAYKWGEIVPIERAIALQKISGDKIKVDLSVYG